MKFVFLVLHYKNADVTIQCLDSILSTIRSEDYSIVVVDNASENGSYEELCSKYCYNPKMHFLKNSENIGYARGNNVGFQYAKEVLKADWICLANNDLIFSDPNWIEKAVAFYNTVKYYVMGPDIVTPSGEHQNPFKINIAKKKEIQRKILHDEIVYWLLKIGIQRKIRGMINVTSAWDKVDYQTTIEDFDGTLHGSCLIFSPKYIQRFNGLYSGTFLYAEEEILCYLMKRLECRYSYNSNMQVTHCHSMTFKRSEEDADKRKMIIIKHRIFSYRKFLQIISDNKNLDKYLISNSEDVNVEKK